VLHALARGYSYGFDIMGATGLPSGTVYPALRRLERQRWINAGVTRRQGRGQPVGAVWAGRGGWAVGAVGGTGRWGRRRGGLLEGAPESDDLAIPLWDVPGGAEGVRTSNTLS
jgi:hypothetical protein